jgi:hypothetical protein
MNSVPVSIHLPINSPENSSAVLGIGYFDFYRIWTECMLDHFYLMRVAI